MKIHPARDFWRRVSQGFQDEIGMLPRTFMRRYGHAQDWRDLHNLLDQELWDRWQHETTYAKAWCKKTMRERMWQLLLDWESEYFWLPQERDFMISDKWPTYQLLYGQKHEHKL